MSLNNLPAALQGVIQQGYLERKFHDALKANLGFRDIADREPFPAGIGETITKTRRGLLAPALTPISTLGNTDSNWYTSGLTPKNYSVEQYILGVQQYADQMALNLVATRVAIVPLFLQNVAALGEQAARTMDMLAQQALFNAYMGGQTRVRTTLGSPAATISVDDIRGFQTTLNSAGYPVAVSTTNTMTVTVGATAYTLQSATADGSNVSTAPGGISGTLTFSANVSTTDGTAGNAVISAVAPSIIRPYVTASGAMAATTAAISASNDNNGGMLTTQMLLNAKAQLRLNNVQPLANGRFNLYADPAHLTGIYQDQAFQRFFTGQPGSAEYRNGEVGEILGIRVIETNLNPSQSLSGNTVRRAILCGQGALIEGEFTRTGYAAVEGVADDPLITVVDGVAHVTREPMDALKQVMYQSWTYIGGFCVPTDSTANPSVLPTATNSLYKRAVILESF